MFYNLSGKAKLSMASCSSIMRGVEPHAQQSRMVTVELPQKNLQWDERQIASRITTLLKELKMGTYTESH